MSSGWWVPNSCWAIRWRQSCWSGIAQQLFGSHQPLLIGHAQAQFTHVTIQLECFPRLPGITGQQAGKSLGIFPGAGVRGQDFRIFVFAAIQVLEAGRGHLNLGGGARGPKSLEIVVTVVVALVLDTRVRPRANDRWPVRRRVMSRAGRTGTPRR